MDSSLPPRVTGTPRGVPAGLYPPMTSAEDSQLGIASSSKCGRWEPARRRLPPDWLSWGFVPPEHMSVSGVACFTCCIRPRPGFQPSSRIVADHLAACAAALPGFSLQSVSSQRSVSVSGAMPSCRFVGLGSAKRGCRAFGPAIDFRALFPPGIRVTEITHGSPGLWPSEARARRPPDRGFPVRSTLCFRRCPFREVGTAGELGVISTSDGADSREPAGLPGFCHLVPASSSWLVRAILDHGFSSPGSPASRRLPRLCGSITKIGRAHV